METFEVSTPGVQVAVAGSEQDVQDTELLIHLLITCLGDAAIALALFEDARSSFHTLDSTAEDEARIRDSMTSQLATGLSEAERAHALASIALQARMQAKDLRRVRLRSDPVPIQYRHRLQFLHAKSCLYGLDGILKALEQMDSLPTAPASLKECLTNYRAHFPSLKKVRNSAHHAEDRVQGKHRDTRLDIKPIPEEIGVAVGRINVVDALTGNRYGGTLENGHYGEVEVSSRSLAAAQRVVQAALNCYEWDGPSITWPLPN